MADYRKKTGGTLYISQAKDPSVTKPTGSNAAGVISDFESISYDEMGVLNAFAVEHLFENDNINYAMNCDIAGAFLKTSDRKWNINSAIYSPNIDVLAKLTDYFREDILGTPVAGETFDYVVGTTYDSHELPKSNSALYAAYSLTSLIEDVTAYSLIENTDYTVATVNGVQFVIYALRIGNISTY